jgi:hypothetical protein
MGAFSFDWKTQKLSCRPGVFKEQAEKPGTQ